MRGLSLLLVSAFVLVMAAVSGCKPDGDVVACHRFCPVAADGWDRFDTVSITVDSIARSADYVMEAQVRVRSGFAYRGLYVEVGIEADSIAPDAPALIGKDTVYMAFDTDCDNLVGYTGGYKVVTASLPSVQLVAGQRVDIRLRHLMRSQTIPLVTDVGCKLVCRR